VSTPGLPLAPTEFMTVTVRIGKDDSLLAAANVDTDAATDLSPVEDSLPIFSARDAGVEPPSLARPQLPTTQTGNDALDQLSEFELLISRTGRVEQVRLISPGNRLNDRMLIAAAKAWQFHPAMKDGQPVRYRYHIRIVP
jgi:TonB family protein